MINDSNEGEMMKFLKQGKCPRFFSLSFNPHFNHILSFDTHSMTEMSCHIGRQRYQVYAHSISHFNIIEHHFSLTLSSFIWWWIWTIKFLPYREAGVSSLRLFHFSFPHHSTSFQTHSILSCHIGRQGDQVYAKEALTWYPCLPIWQKFDCSNSASYKCHSTQNDVGMTWMMLEWGTFSMEMILIFLIPRPSLSFWVILKCLFCHSLVILALNDVRVNKMML